MEDAFWSPRLKTNRDVTIWYDFARCEETGRIANFARAGGLEEGPFQGIFFNDSDVFKVIEGAAYALALEPDERLDRYLDDLIEKIAAAQEADGYLYTARSLRPDDPPEGSGKTRWSNLRSSHELYNAGHLYEAAVAHYLATGKETLLNVAKKNADLLVETFGEDGRLDVPGHEEIELGLFKLYRVTGREAYLELGRFFLDLRGRGERRELYGQYCQDHQPVTEQSEAVGHAVRAGYLYSAMADLSALTGDAQYRAATLRLWTDIVSRKMYVTGGIGSSRGGEAFGEPYDLPNATAYNETCAAIALALFNHRLFLESGDARYLDVLERVLYNGFLAGVSLGGDTFFYPNPLATDGRQAFNQGSRGRSPWFDCACCPVNVVRFLPSMPGFVYAAREDVAFVNLYVGGQASLELSGGPVRLTVRTELPWQGRTEMTVDPGASRSFEIRLRIPGWAQGRPVPGDLYRYLEDRSLEFELSVNGEAESARMAQGFACLRRTWEPGDRIELILPVEPRRVVANELVEADRGKVALERGPLVYCFEQVDQGESLGPLVLQDDAAITADPDPGLSGGLAGVTALGVSAERVVRAKDGSRATEPKRLLAVPYYAWAHRELGEMAVWMPRSADQVELPPEPTLASRSRAGASHCFERDSIEAINDLREPKNSGDHEIPRLTFWDHRGGREWVQLDLPEPTALSALQVYWFDDTGRGLCRVPASFEIQVETGTGWQAVQHPTPRGVERDRFNRVTFDPITAHSVRLSIELQPDFSAGILELRLD